MEEETTDMQYLSWPAMPIQPSDFISGGEEQEAHRAHAPRTNHAPVQLDYRQSTRLPPAREENLATMFRNRSALFGDALRWKANVRGRWWHMSWAENKALVNRLIAGLTALGVKPGDRIGILSETRWEWLAVDWAILGMGAVSVTIYPNLTVDTIAFMLIDSDTKVLFAQNRGQYDKIKTIRASLPGLEKIILFEDAEEFVDDPAVMSLSHLCHLSSATAQQADDLAERYAAAIRPEMMASIIYTSGTTGRPKGVIHTQASMMAQVRSTGEAVTTFRPGMSHLLWLPLAHVLGRSEHLLALDRGGVTVFAESPNTLARDIAAMQPNVIIGVPRIYEKAYAAVRAQVASSNPLRQRIFRWATRIGLQTLEKSEKGEPISPRLRAAHAIADRLVFHKVRAGLGGHLEFSVTGAAPIEREVLNFFHAAGVLILEGWGLTETMAAIAVNRPEKCRLGSVGPATPRHEIRIASDGEILLRGPCLFTGYLNNPAENKVAFTEDGWFRTGDIGYLDADGFLYITGRKKELIATAAGKKVVPDHIEALLKTITCVSQAAVFGDRKPYLVALLTLDEGELRDWASANGIPWSSAEQIAAMERFRTYLDVAITRINTRLARHETVKKYAVVPGGFTIENDLLTPTLKVRRHAVEKRYGDVIENLYTEGSFVPQSATAEASRTGSVVQISG